MDNSKYSRAMEAALKRILKTLNDKVRPEHTAVIVVDMQNDFCEKGGMFDKEGCDISSAQKIVPGIKNLIEKARQYGVSVIFVKNVQSAKCNYLSDVWLEQNMRSWKGGRYIKYPVCEKDAWGSEFYNGIQPKEGDYVVIKHRYSAFEGTDLDMILRSNGIKTLIVTGAATNVCVESTVRQGFMKEYYIVVPEDCTASISKELHETSLYNIDKWFGQVVTSDEIIKCWEESCRK